MIACSICFSISYMLLLSGWMVSASFLSFLFLESHLKIAQNKVGNSRSCRSHIWRPLRDENEDDSNLEIPGDMAKSPESNFWITIPQNEIPATSSESSRIPAIPRLDREAGILPRGSYRVIEDDGVDSLKACSLTIGIRPPPGGNEGRDVWGQGIKNAQQLIDCGFNTFRVNNIDERLHEAQSRTNTRAGVRGGPRSPWSISDERKRRRNSRTRVRHEAETNFYEKMRQDTPASILRSCHFMFNIEIPSVLSDIGICGKSSDEVAVPFGNGWMVREDLSSALLRFGGECLDSVTLEYREDSPYHLDVLNTLCEMKHEGLIRSISTRNFPSSLLKSALNCRFDIQSNDICGNLIRSCDLRSDGEMGTICTETGCSRLISGPLGGGLFTNQFSSFQDWSQLKVPEKRKFGELFNIFCPESCGIKIDGAAKKWEAYRAVLDVLADISFQHQVSIESVVLRWLLQLNLTGDIAIVGTDLGMDFVEEQGGPPYRRGRDLRQVFTFSLDEDDMERLRLISECTFGNQIQGEQVNPLNEHSIDFQNQSLWL